MIKLADTLQPMADFPSAYAKDIAFDDGDTLQEKLDTGSLGGSGGYTQLSQAEYDALTEDEKLDGREYRTYDTGHIYKLGVEYGKDGVQISDNETVEDKTWSSQKISDEIADIESALDELENITRLTDFDEAIPEKGKNKIYYVNKLIGTYKCAQWRVESMYYDVSGAKQYRGVQKATSINGVDNIMLMREYYLDNNVMRWGAWQRVCTTSVADVPLTTITTSNLSNDKITAGTVSYCVKNGVCYVYVNEIRYSEECTNVPILENMPKSLITSGAHAVTTPTQYCFIAKNETTLKLHCFKTDETIYCSFSYPVAES